MQKIIITILVLICCTAKCIAQIDLKPYHTKTTYAASCVGFESATVADYKWANARMAIYLSMAGLNERVGYVMPGRNGPMIVILSINDDGPISRDKIEKIFALMDEEVRRIKKHGHSGVSLH